MAELSESPAERAAGRRASVEMPLLRIGDFGGPRPPRVRGLPLLGSIREYLRRPIPFFVECYRRFGPIFRVRLAAAEFVVLAGPEAAQLFLRNERDLFVVGEQYAPWKRVIGVERVIVNQNADLHRQLRTMTRPGMSRQVIEQRIAETSGVIDDYLDTLKPGDVVPVTRFMQHLVVRQLGTLVAGDPAEEHHDDFNTLLGALVDALMRPWRNYLPLPGEVRRARERLVELTRRLRSEHEGREQDPVRPNLIVDVLAARREGLLAEHDLPLNLLVPYLAGLDTVSFTMSFLFYVLMTDETVRREVQREVDAAYDEGPLDADRLRKMDVLRSTVQETLRLYPVSSGITRETVQPFEWNGYQVDAGRRVLVAHTVAHFLEEHWPEPERFDRYRFGKERAEHRKPGVYHPFGVGSHTCLGAGIAEAQLMLTTAHLLRHAELSMEPPGYELRTEIIPLARPVGLSVRYRGRRQR